MTRAAEQEIRSKVRARLRASTLRGAGRLLDFGGSYREDAIRSIEEQRRERKSDAESIAQAWQRVGQYLNRAIHQFEAEHSKHE